MIPTSLFLSIGVITPQHNVVTFAGHPAECDLLICLFRHKFGSPLPEADFGLNSSGQRWTGTEWELAQATKDCWLFRDTSAFICDASWSTEEEDAAIAQRRKVDAFVQAATDASGSIQRGYQTYSDDDDFAAMVEARLKEWLQKRRGSDSKVAAQPSEGGAPSLTDEQKTLLQQLLTEGSCNDHNLLKAAKQGPHRCVRSYLLSRYAEWSMSDAGNLDLEFVNLNLHVDLGPGLDGHRQQHAGEFNDLRELLASEHVNKAALLVGDPGSGKSTVLQQYEMRQAVEGLKELERAGRLELCVYARLSAFRQGGDEALDPTEWLQDYWHKRYPLMPPLRTLAAECDLRYVLDGLNEMQVAGGRAYIEAVQRWSQWLDLNIGCPALFSVRTLNYNESIKGSSYVELARWSPDQIQSYVRSQPLKNPEGLITSLNAQDMQDFNGLPIDLKHQCQLFDELGRAAESRAELLSGLGWLKLRQNKLSAEQLDALLGERDKRQMNQPSYWREHLLQLPDQGVLLKTLDAVAHAMHCDAAAQRWANP